MFCQDLCKLFPVGTIFLEVAPPALRPAGSAGAVVTPLHACGPAWHSPGRQTNLIICILRLALYAGLKYSLRTRRMYIVHSSVKDKGVRYATPGYACSFVDPEIWSCDYIFNPHQASRLPRGNIQAPHARATLAEQSTECLAESPWCLRKSVRTRMTNPYAHFGPSSRKCACT